MGLRLLRFGFCVTYDSQHRYSPGRLALSAPYRVTPLCRLSRLCQNYEQSFYFHCIKYESDFMFA